MNVVWQYFSFRQQEKTQRYLRVRTPTYCARYHFILRAVINNFYLTIFLHVLDTASVSSL